MIAIRLHIVSIMVFFLITKLSAQKEDHIWLFGASVADNLDSSEVQDSTWGSTIFDFNFDPPKIEYDSNRIWDIRGTNASICNNLGELQFYSNGQAIYGANNEVISDTINFNQTWINWSFELNGEVFPLGLPIIQGALIIPSPKNNSEYYLFYQQFIEDVSEFQMLYCTIDLSNPVSIMNKDQLLVNDSIGGGGLTTCRHANGRDWWVMFPSNTNNLIHTYLLDPYGLTQYPIQNIGIPFTHSVGQMYFSPSGDKLSINTAHIIGEDGANVVFWDFDRCSGLLSNAVSDTIASYGIGHGFAFSPNGRLAYVSNEFTLYQYDMTANNIIDSRIKVADYDGYSHTYTEFPDTHIATTIGWMGLAPDGRIYSSTGTSQNRKMHVMHNPNQLGLACDFRQHSILLADYKRTIPNYANFRLGPLDGSPCDTLDIDNIPVAKFRCDQDTTDQFSFRFIDLSYFEPNEWIWTIDGQIFNEQHPSFNFEEGGIYTVCLEVKNENGNDALCKTLNLGVSSTQGPMSEIPLTIFPNPVKVGLTVSLHNYYPVNAHFVLYDIEGRKVLDEPFLSNWNSYNLGFLSPGLFYYNILQGNQVLKSGKLIKI